jgi:hypothetical protein
MLKCEDCELRMAEFDFGAEIEAHLRVCADCRGLAEELRENLTALHAMRDEEFTVEQTLVCNGGFSRRWAAVTAAAALALLAISLAWHRKAPVVAPPSPPVVAAAPPPAPEIVAVAPIRKHRRKIAKPKPPQPEETLMVKMLTPDPDIVIYWIVEPKEKSE